MKLLTLDRERVVCVYVFNLIREGREVEKLLYVNVCVCVATTRPPSLLFHAAFRSFLKVFGKAFCFCFAKYGFYQFPSIPTNFPPIPTNFPPIPIYSHQSPSNDRRTPNRLGLGVLRTKYV